MSSPTFRRPAEMYETAISPIDRPLSIGWCSPGWSRAASALDCALDADPHTAASETLYEAFAALGDLDELRGLVAGELA